MQCNSPRLMATTQGKQVISGHSAHGLALETIFSVSQSIIAVIPYSAIHPPSLALTSKLMQFPVVFTTTLLLHLTQTAHLLSDRRLHHAPMQT